MKTRTAARALIEDEGHILFSKCKDSNGVFYVLPGGKIETNELAEEAVLRECIEETGYSVKVEELVLVKEFIKKIPDVEVFKNGIHQIELIFKCKLDKNKAKQEAKAMDVYQIALEWLPINALKDLRVYPTQNIASYLKKNHSLVKYISLREEGF
ncbi:MAG: NUDIX domain-containing protein [Chitinophagales bacterium]